MSTVNPIGFRCPVCASTRGRWAAQHHGLRVARCVACGHGYVWPVPSESFLNSIYSDDRYYRGGQGSIGFTDYGSLGPARKRMFNRHLGTIEAAVSVGRILDVGCASGDFLKVARERGWEVLGADPSVARAEVESSGIQLVGTTVHDSQVGAGSLDAITFWDVIEHVADPIADLTRACELLRPGGVLALTVPDSSNLVARVSGRRWFGYKTAGEHLQFFTPVSLRKAFDRAGLSLRVRRPTTWSCTVGFLTDRAGLYLGPPGRLINRSLSGSRLMSVIVDVPQINQFALGGPARVTSQVNPGAPN